MTVEELIRELKWHDPESEVHLAFRGDLHQVETIEWGKVYRSPDQDFDRLGVIVFAENS